MATVLLIGDTAATQHFFYSVFNNVKKDNFPYLEAHVLHMYMFNFTAHSSHLSRSTNIQIIIKTSSLFKYFFNSTSATISSDKHWLVLVNQRNDSKHLRERESSVDELKKIDTNEHHYCQHHHYCDRHHIRKTQARHAYSEGIRKIQMSRVK